MGVVRGHGQVGPIIVGDVVQLELRDAPGGARTLKRDARGGSLTGGAAVSLNDPVTTVPLG
jgi:hypothetical protein